MKKSGLRILTVVLLGSSLSLFFNNCSDTGQVVLVQQALSEQQSEACVDCLASAPNPVASIPDQRAPASTDPVPDSNYRPAPTQVTSPEQTPKSPPSSGHSCGSAPSRPLFCGYQLLNNNFNKKSDKCDGEKVKVIKSATNLSADAGNVDGVAVLGIYNVSNNSLIAGKRFATEMKVHVTSKTKARVLILYAHEPTIWKILGESGHLNEIIIIGEHCQRLTNVDTKKVKVRYATLEEPGNFDHDLKQIFATASSWENMPKSIESWIKQNSRYQHLQSQFIYQGSCINSQFEVE